MRVLFVDTRQGGDWSLDLLYGGLCRVLGAESVVDFPAQAKHRMRVPLEMTGDKERDYGTERRSLAWFPRAHETRSLDAGEVRAMVRGGEFDLAVTDERRESIEACLALRTNFFDLPIAIVAGHDRFWNGSPCQLLRSHPGRIVAMFLDNWRPEYADVGVPTFHYSWCANFDHLWRRPSVKPDKTVDLFFAGFCSDPSRLRYVRHVIERWTGSGGLVVDAFLETRHDTFESFVMKGEYFERMARAKVCLNMRGGAENGKALRFYEIPHVGSFMLSERHPGADTVEPPFVDGEHCAYFGDEAELDRAIERWVHDDAGREAIAAAGAAHLDAHHTARARARQFLSRVAGVLDG